MAVRGRPRRNKRWAAHRRTPWPYSSPRQQAAAAARAAVWRRRGDTDPRADPHADPQPDLHGDVRGDSNGEPDRARRAGSSVGLLPAVRVEPQSPLGLTPVRILTDGPGVSPAALMRAAGGFDVGRLRPLELPERAANAYHPPGPATPVAAPRARPAAPEAPPEPQARSRRRLVLRSVGAAAAVAVTVGALAFGNLRDGSEPADAPAVASGEGAGIGVAGAAGAEVPTAAPASVVTLVAPDDQLAYLLGADETSVVAHARRDVTVYEGPGLGQPIRRLEHPTSNGSPLVMRVDAEADGGRWLRAQLPVRPNGTTGWIRAEDVELRTHRFRITVDVTERRFTLYRAGEVVMESPVAVGATDTPTPGGVFYVKELLQPPDPNTVYGPYAFGLSGFSNVLDSFAGGEGVIGIHGTDDPDAIGREVSHGCIRLPNDRITELVGVLPLGTPVAILG